MQAIFFALISFLGWGIGDVFGALSSRKIGGYSTTFWFLALQVPIFVFPAVIYFGNLKNLTLGLLTLNIALALIGTIGLIGFYEGLKIANAPLVGSISASFVGVTVLLSILFLGETINVAQLSAILIILLGLFVSTLDINEVVKRKLKLDKGIVLSLITMITWGVYWAFIKIPIKSLGWYWPGYISVLGSLPILYLFLKINGIRIEAVNHKGSFWPLFLNSLLLGIGALSFNFAIDQGQVAIVAPIAGSYPALFCHFGIFGLSRTDYAPANFRYCYHSCRYCIAFNFQCLESQDAFLVYPT